MSQFSQEIHDQLVQFCREELIFMGLRRQRESQPIQPTLYLFEFQDDKVTVPEKNIELRAPLEMDHVRELCEAFTGDLAGYMVVYVGEFMADGEIFEDNDMAETCIYVPKAVEVQVRGITPNGRQVTDKALVGLIEFDDSPYTLVSSICQDGSISDVTVSKAERISNFENVLVERKGYVN